MRTLFIAIILSLTLIANAYAHSKVKTSLPADGAELGQIPSSIEINFEMPARVTKVSLSHTEGAEDHEDRLDIPTKDFVTSLSLTPELYGAGQYEIEWRALAEDGHAMKGSFSFTVKAE